MPRLWLCPDAVRLYRYGDRYCLLGVRRNYHCFCLVDDFVMSEPIEFRAADNDGRPKLQRARGGGKKTAYCPHRAQMTINEDTQLVTCKGCGLVMSAYSALLVITRQWESMHYDVTEWKKMNAERQLAQKLSDVRRKIRELQWIETPEVGDEPARTYWARLTKALGKEPYAMFRRGRQGTRGGVQYCVLNGDGSGWADVEHFLKRAEATAGRNEVGAAKPREEERES